MGYSFVIHKYYVNMIIIIFFVKFKPVGIRRNYFRTSSVIFSKTAVQRLKIKKRGAVRLAFGLEICSVILLFQY